jgi:hypothetical protein
VNPAICLTHIPDPDRFHPDHAPITRRDRFAALAVIV